MKMETLTKPCNKCGYETDQYRAGHRTCKPCEAAYKKVWYQSNREDHLRRSREGRYLREYGITISDYESLVAYQGSRCAICDELSESLVVDHCHDTGKVRGLLCANCNTGIGLLKDNPNNLSAALRYLEHSYEVI